ncbi:MAG: DNA polymerase IV [Gammaproteobacteria bacterium]|nr:MAG: DNA polymerase IV [Gammaproteobacteria bacterium]
MILHVDMDAFYTSVEQRDQPELKGQPVVVGGHEDARGVVAAASYEARRYGIHSAMPSREARRRCPQLVMLAGRHAYYAEVSRSIHAIFHRYTPLVQPLSLDEAFLDVSESERLFGSAVEIGKRIRSQIRRELDLTASVGVAPNKFVAKIASDLNKPDAMVVVHESDMQGFLDPLPVSRVWGVGKVTESKLRHAGIETIAQLRKQSEQTLQALMGTWGLHIWRLAQGQDDSEVVPDYEARSLSHEVTFVEDVHDADVLHEQLVVLVESVAHRLRCLGKRGCTVQLKLRFPDFKTISRSRTLKTPTDITAELLHGAMSLLAAQAADIKKGIRLLGMGVSNLGCEAVQQDLFESENKLKQSHLDDISDTINQKFGNGALRRGGYQTQRKH